MRLADYIGIPYTDKGRSIEGVDCWGLVQLVYKHELGIDIPDYLTLYQSCTDMASVRSAIEEGQVDGHWQQVEALEPSDVLLFQINGKITHCAVYLGEDLFLHSFNKCDTAIERLSSVSWRHRFKKAFRWIKSQQ